MTANPIPGSERTSKRVLCLKILLVVAIVGTLHFAGSWFAHTLEFQIFPRHDAILHLAVLATSALYVLLLLTPFMPGIEIGLALMMTLGSKGALLVYLCTVLAVSISFAIGQIVPPRLLGAVLSWLHLHKASDLVHQIELMDRQQRLDFLNEHAPAVIAPFILKYRYLTIAAALNLPGNALLGGGGGIGLIAGMSKLIAFPHFILVTAIAVAPVPLWFFLYGG